MRRPAQQDGLLEDAGIAMETPPPQTFGHDNNVIVIGPVLFGGEIAAEQRMHTQHRKQV